MTYRLMLRLALQAISERQFGMAMHLTSSSRTTVILSRFITQNVTDPAPWICTYKAALHLWPDAPKHSNQVLRYWRGMQLNPALAMPPHRAAPDAWVTAHLLAEMIQLAPIGQLIAWTDQPPPMPVIPFGMHRGSPWADIPTDYLNWMIGVPDMDGDAVWHARQELARRGH
jgi:exodeoxyribonuclease X